MNKRLLLISGTLAILGYLCWHLSDDPLFRYLSFSTPLDKPNLLIVEGWLNDEELEEASKIFQDNDYKYIITTGVTTPPFYKMWVNGNLVIDVKRFNIQKGLHELIIEAYSTTARDKNANFEVWVNDEKIGETTTTTLLSHFKFNFESFLATDSISIRFINDDYYRKQDINLYISNITIDSVKFSVIDTLNYFRDNGNPNFKHVLAKTNAIRIKHILMQYHIPPEKIIPVSTISYTTSRTAETAKITMEFIDSVFHCDSIRSNIFSTYPHTRRTFLAYKKFKKGKQQIGIVASTSNIANIKEGRLNNLKELIGIIYLKMSR